jgi:hypothetical protein
MDIRAVVYLAGKVEDVPMVSEENVTFNLRRNGI